MSRIGKKPITIPKGVEVQIKDHKINVKGPKGELSYQFRPEVSVGKKDDQIVVSAVDKDGHNFWGLTRSLIKNMVVGVTEGYVKKLEMHGIGYRVQKTSDGLSLSVGFSHPVEIKQPEGIRLETEGNTKIIISGIDKALVGEIAAKIRRIRPPESYKGKGIRYEGEVIKLKPGKAGGK